MSGTRPILKARCRCPAGHVTYVRSGNLTVEYVREKIHWLFNDTCYADDQEPGSGNED